MEEHIKFIKEAIALAENNSKANGGGPFGAVIVKDGKVVASTSNSVTVDNDPTAHAEVNAIRQACKHLGTFDLSGCVLYTSCEPCPMCLSASYWARLDKIYYAASASDAADAGFDDAFIYKELALPIADRSVPMLRIAEKEGRVPFDNWIKNEIKVKY